MYDVLHVLLCLPTGTHQGGRNFQFRVEVFVQPVVSCPQPEDGNLLRFCEQVEAVFLSLGSEQSRTESSFEPQVCGTNCGVKSSPGSGLCRLCIFVLNLRQHRRSIRHSI